MEQLVQITVVFLNQKIVTENLFIFIFISVPSIRMLCGIKVIVYMYIERTVYTK